MSNKVTFTTDGNTTKASFDYDNLPDVEVSSTKKEIDRYATVVTQSAPSTIELTNNTEYYLTDVTSLTLTYPDGKFECWLRITTASLGTVTISLPTSEYIGTVPTFGNDETWELSIKDGVIVAGQVTV